MAADQHKYGQRQKVEQLRHERCLRLSEGIECIRDDGPAQLAYDLTRQLNARKQNHNSQTQQQSDEQFVGKLFAKFGNTAG